MLSFVQRFKDQILGVLSGFDRLRFRGSLPRLASVGGMLQWLESKRILVKDFPTFADQQTKELREVLNQKAAQEGRPVEYLASYTDKEALVQKRRSEVGSSPSGLICALSTLEGCTSYDVSRNAKSHTIALRKRPRKCLHYYFYFEDERFGLTQVRLQTWFPFGVNVVLNGREWLSRQLTAEGIGYQRKDNCFTWVEDFARAQALANEQPRIHWEAELERLLHWVWPAKRNCFPNDRYFWTVDQSEWATDVAFRDAAVLAELYPQFIRRGIETFRSEDVLRFLGRKVTAEGHVPASFRDELTSDLKHRPEGVRIKHRAGQNSIKLYDKQGSVIRAETTFNDVKGFKSYRPPANNPEGKPTWQPMRKGVAEMPRRAELSQASNERYLEAMATLPADTPLSRVAQKLCQPVVIENRRHRGLNPLSSADSRLLEIVCRGEYLLAGFRNRDVRQAFYGEDADETKRRRQASATTRLLGLLRAHGLIKKIPRTHRYLLTTEGTKVIPALLAANNATLQQLMTAA